MRLSVVRRRKDIASSFISNDEKNPAICPKCFLTDAEIAVILQNYRVETFRLQYLVVKFTENHKISKTFQIKGFLKDILCMKGEKTLKKHDVL